MRITLTNRSSWITTSKSLKRPQFQWTVSIQTVYCLVFLVDFFSSVNVDISLAGAFDLGFQTAGWRLWAVFRAVISRVFTGGVWKTCFRAAGVEGWLDVARVRRRIFLCVLVGRCCTTSLEIKRRTWREPLRLWAEFANSGSSLSCLGDKFLWSKW